MNAAAQALTPQQRRIVALVVREGLADREIAERLGISRATVQFHLSAARAALGGDGCGQRFWVRAAYALGMSESCTR